MVRVLRTCLTLGLGVFSSVLITVSACTRHHAPDFGSVKAARSLPDFTSARTVRIVVDQDYTGIPNLELPFTEITALLLRHCGLEPVPEDCTEYDATVAIRARGMPLGEVYESGTYRYTGFRGYGMIIISYGDDQVESMSFDCHTPAGKTVLLYQGGYRSPSNAPCGLLLSDGFLPTFLRWVYRTFGARPLISAAADSYVITISRHRLPDGTEIADSSGLGIGDVLVDSPEASLPCLFDALQDEESPLAACARSAIGLLFSRLSSSGKPLPDGVLRILRSRTGHDFGPYASGWQKWWDETVPFYKVGTYDGIRYCICVKKSGNSSFSIMDGFEYRTSQLDVRIQDGTLIVNGMRYGHLENGDDLKITVDADVFVNGELRAPAESGVR